MIREKEPLNIKHIDKQVKSLISGLLKKKPEERLSLKAVLEADVIKKSIQDLKNEYPELVSSINNIINPQTSKYSL